MKWAWLFIIVFIFPIESFAWAPATHLYFAKEVLYFGYLLPPSLQVLLTQYRLDFFYGCIAADITIGKAFVEYLHNCHNFDVGLKLLDQAKDDAEKAFVLGYLSHLAADTVSHNYFVPYQNIEHIETVGKFRHAYWEVRLDQFFHGVWDEIEPIIQNPRNHTHDKLLDRALKETLFSFKTNKILFSSMLAVQRLKKWQLFIKGINQLSDLKFNGHHLSEYNRLAVTAIIHFLSEKKKSPVYPNDPTGGEAIQMATAIRKNLKKKQKSGVLSKSEHEEECLKFREFARKKYFSQYLISDSKFHPSIHMNL